MKYQKQIKLILTSLAFTLFLLLVANNYKSVSNKISAKSNFFRNLISDENLERACKNASKEVQSYYNDRAKFEKTYETFNVKENKYSKSLLDYVKDNYDELKEGEFDKDKITEFIKSYYPRIILFVIGIVLIPIGIICWIFFCVCCCCCPCCCCKKPEETGCCSKISFIISMALLAGILIGAFYSFSVPAQTTYGYYGTQCSVFQFVDELLEGENSNDEDSWKGVNKIVESIKDFTNQTDNLNQMKTEIGESFDDVEDKKEELQDDINESFNQKRSPEVQNLYNESMRPALESFSQMLDNTDKLTQINDIIKDVNLDEYKDSIGNIGDQLAEAKEQVEDVVDQVTDTWFKIDDYADKYLKIALYLIWVVVLLLVALIIVFSFLTAMCHKCDCCLFPCCVKLDWNLLMFVNLIFLLLGALFGFIGTVLSDGVYVVNYVVSEDNLDKDHFLIKEGTLNDVIKSCKYGNGSLTELLKLTGDLSLDVINDLLAKAGELNNVLITVEEIKKNFTDETEAAKKYLGEAKSSSSMTLSQKAEIEDLIQQIVNIENKFEKMVGSLEKGLTKSMNLSDAVKDILKIEGGESQALNLDNLINCKFIRYHVNILFDQLGNEAGNSLRSYASCLIISIILFLVGTCFLIVFINHCSGPTKKNKKSDKASPEDVKLEIKK